MNRAQSRRWRWIRTGAVLFTIVAAAAGCRGTLSIGELLDDPGQYDGERVRVVGEVTEAAGVLGRGAYRLSDDTGTIVVISRQGEGVPRQGARVRVDGWFRPALTFGAETVAALEEVDRGRP